MLDSRWKAIHLESTRKLLGFAGVLSGNGNFIERIVGRLVVSQSGILDELRPLVSRALSRQVHDHYRGFAANQRKALEREATAKKLLYVLRTALTGIHLLQTGELERATVEHWRARVGAEVEEWLLAVRARGLSKC